ncbi:MAG: rRNA pseudouridine synthase [Erysipelotrichaceae bacterium]|nr:rRNA pseudouridine synthase [Erysipelotrichaceae bacterium]
MERLQKVIAKAGIASRRKAEELIRSGRVKVNGKTVTEMGVQVSPSDTVSVDGKELQKENKVYYLLNKPKKTICSLKDEKDRPTVLSCFADVGERIFPIGRLDYETTGILLLTNDGDFANQMMHPRYHLPKTYEVAVDGVISDNMAAMLRRGIMLEGRKTLPAEVEILARSAKKNKTVLHITIYEGRNREIRKMMEYFHCDVTRLARIGYGFLTLGNLRQGQYRRLRPFEVRKLIAMSENQSAPQE